MKKSPAAAAALLASHAQALSYMDVVDCD